MVNPNDPVDKQIIEQAQWFERYIESVGRTRKRHKIIRLFTVFVFVILINGVFIGILWITNVLELLKQDEGFIVTPLRVLIATVYIAYIFFVSKILIRLLGKIGIPWLFDHD